MIFANIFSQSVAYFFILLQRAEIFNFNELQLIDSFMGCGFHVVSKNISSSTRSSRFSPSPEGPLATGNELEITVVILPPVPILMAALIAQIPASNRAVSVSADQHTSSTVSVHFVLTN